MVVCILFLFQAVSGHIYAAADQVLFSVIQTPKEVVVHKGGNVVFCCILPIFPDQSWVRVLWWKQGENEYQRTSADKRKRPGQRSKVTWFFELQNTMIQDSGVYVCSVTRQGMSPRNGTGSLLIVNAVPTPLRVFAKIPQRNSADYIVVCETAAFYPMNFTLTWYKNGVETTTGIHTKAEQNAEELYEASSSLTVTEPDQNDGNYTCVVSHVSLNTSAFAVYYVHELKQGPSTLEPGRMVAGLVFIMLILSLVMWCRTKKK